MSWWDNISKGFKEGLDRRREEREQLHKLQREAAFQQRQAFEEEFRKQSLEVAKERAKRDAAKATGMAKLQAINRKQVLDQPSNSFFTKLAIHTQKNLAKREENLKRTAEVRKAAKEMQEERINKIQNERSDRMAKIQNRETSRGGWY